LGGGVAMLIAAAAMHSPLVTHDDALMQYAFVMGVVMAVGVSSVVVFPLVERSEALGRVVLVAVVTSMLGLASTEMIMRTEHNFSPYQSLMAGGRQAAAQKLALYQKADLPADALANVRRWWDLGMVIVPASLLMLVATFFVLSLVMFGRLKAWREFLKRRENPEGATYAPLYLFRSFQLPDWLLFAFIIGGLTPLASGMLQKVAANILAIVAFLYFLQGLAIFRSMLIAIGAGFGGTMFSIVLLGI